MIHSVPAVVSMFRLAIASVDESPQVARILERSAFEPNRLAPGEMMARAIEAGILSGDASRLAVRFFALLTGGAHVPIRLGIAAPREAARAGAVFRGSGRRFLAAARPRLTLVACSAPWSGVSWFVR